MIKKRLLHIFSREHIVHFFEFDFPAIFFLSTSMIIRDRNIWLSILLSAFWVFFLVRYFNERNRQLINKMWAMAASLGLTAEDLSRISTFDQEVLEASKDEKFHLGSRMYLSDVEKIMQQMENLTSADKARLVRLREAV